MAKTNKISIEANKLFFKPNCKNVKAALKIKFKMKGKATIAGISFLITLKKTDPKEIKIITYKKVQTGPKSQLGGAQLGLINFEYQTKEFITQV